MKNFFVWVCIVSCCVFLAGMAQVGYSPQVNAAYDQIKAELRQKGVNIQPVEDAGKVLKDLLAQGVKKDDLKKYLMDLATKKLDKDAFKNALVSTYELVKNGEAFRKARSLVSSNVDKALKQGLQGKELCAKVNEAVAQRKEQLEVLKAQGLAQAQKMQNGLAANPQVAKAKPFWEAWTAQPATSVPVAPQQPQPPVKTVQKAAVSLPPAPTPSQASTEVAKDLDNAIRPVLNSQFGDARIIFESKAAQTQSDGEVLENQLVYKVRKTLVVQDGFDLHAAFRAKGFAASPRIGGKPMEWKGKVSMSLMRTTPLRPYSLVISVDTNKQQIAVHSYKTGSKYDRMM